MITQEFIQTTLKLWKEIEITKKKHSYDYVLILLRKKDKFLKKEIRKNQIDKKNDFLKRPTPEKCSLTNAPQPTTLFPLWTHTQRAEQWRVLLKEKKNKYLLKI